MQPRNLSRLNEALTDLTAQLNALSNLDAAKKDTYLSNLLSRTKVDHAYIQSNLTDNPDGENLTPFRISMLIDTLTKLNSYLQNNDFPNYETWKSDLEKAHGSAVDSFLEAEDKKRSQNPSWYDSQPGVSPREPDVSITEYNKELQEHNAKIKILEPANVYTRPLQSAMQTLTEIKNELDVAELAKENETNKLRKTFIEKTKAIVDDLVFWNDQVPGLIKNSEPEGLPKIRKILSRWNPASPESNLSVLKELNSFGTTKAAEKKSSRNEVTKKLYTALKELNQSELDALQNIINDSRKVSKKTPSYRSSGDDL